jgi:predicted nicotinamide N-methyase
MDLGTGTGVVGISAVWAGAKDVALTDGALEVLAIAEVNLETNLHVDLHGDARYLAEGYYADVYIDTDDIKDKHKRPETHKVALGRLRWGNSDDIDRWLTWESSDGLSGKYDVICGTEVAYERKSIAPLLQTIKTLLKSRSEGGVAVLRLTPEITDDSKGLGEVLRVIKEMGFRVLAYPRIGDANSQLVKIGLK